MNKITILTLLASLFLYHNSHGQALTNVDTIYADYIKSVQINPRGRTLDFPIINLSGGSIILSFDSFTENIQDYYYIIEHCDRNWNPSSELIETDYLDGFNDELVPNYSISRAVYSRYQNHSLTLPNDLTRFTISGNYLLHIFADDDDGSPVITRRFVVSENLVNPLVEFRRPIDASKIRSHIELDVSLNIENLNAFNPMEDIYLDLYQNKYWGGGFKGIRAQNLAGTKLQFNFNNRLVFPGINEFRNVDIRALNFATEFVSTIEITEDGWNVYVFEDKPRLGAHITLPDGNGNYVIGVRDNVEGPPNIAAEYATVTFTLKYPEILDGDIYLMGEFTDWNTQDRFRMEYVGNDTYKTAVTLKQAFYEYWYGIKRQNEVDFAQIEGSYSQTENQYTGIIYYRPDEARYDRVIGHTTVNSNNF